jgi:hypothetical protein
MARPMKNLPVAEDPLVAFAQELRDLRRSAGNPPLQQMAQLTEVSAASLSKAHSGIHPPTWDIVNAYVTACGGERDPWLHRFEQLRLQRAGGAQLGTTVERWSRTGQMAPPSGVADVSELLALLRALLDLHGFSLRTLGRHAPAYTHSSYGAVLRGSRPLTARLLKELLVGCGVYSLESLNTWFAELGRLSPPQAYEGARIITAMEDSHRYQFAEDQNPVRLRGALELLDQARHQVRFPHPDRASRMWLASVNRLQEHLGATFVILLPRTKALPRQALGGTPETLPSYVRGKDVPAPAYIANFLAVTMPHRCPLGDRARTAMTEAATVLARIKAGLDPMDNRPGRTVPYRDQNRRYPLLRMAVP